MTLKKHVKVSFGVNDLKREVFVFVSAMSSYFFAHTTDIANAQNVPVSRAIMISLGVAAMHGLFDLVLSNDSSLKT